MRVEALSLAALAAVVVALASVRATPRTELAYVTAERGAWRAAIEARIAGTPSRVRGEGDAWSVIVRTADVVPTARTLDWDGTLSFYAPCADPPDVAPRESAAVRDEVEAEVEGPRVRLYEATSVSLARTRCVEAPPLARVVARDASASSGGPASIVVALDDHDAAALTAIGRERSSAPFVIAIRRTILAEGVWPIELTSSSFRFPIVGGDIAPLYAEFFARSLRAPPLARMQERARTPLSPWPEASAGIVLTLLTAIALALVWRRLSATAPSRAIAAVALGACGAALSGWVLAPIVDAPFAESLTTALERAAVEQALVVGAVLAVLFAASGVPGRTEALLASIGVALGFALDRGASDFLLLAPGASLSTSALAAAGRVVLACASGLALSAPRPKRLALATAAWSVATVAEAVAIALAHDAA